MSNFQQVLSQALMSGQILTNEPMSRHTTFRVGGPADYFAKVETEAESWRFAANGKCRIMLWATAAICWWETADTVALS